MSLPECTVNTANIQNLPDSPNISADELKQEFDKAGKELKEYINDLLIPAIENLVRTEKDTLSRSLSETSTKLNNNLIEANSKIDKTKTELEKSTDSKILADNKKRYPVGKIIMSTKNVNPSTYLGFGTWTLWGAGKVPVGVNTADADFNTVEKTGGSKTQGLRALIGATHNTPYRIGYLASAPVKGKSYSYSTMGTTLVQNIAEKDINHSTPVVRTDGKDATTLQPYITCYMFKRTA